MRKPFHMFAAAAFALSILAGGCAKGIPPPQPQPAKKEIPASEKKAAVPKPHAKLFTGTIEDLDEAAGTFILKGPKGERRFHAREQVMEQLDGLEIGDKVIVKHVDEIALAIVKPRTSKSALILEDPSHNEKVIPAISNS
jgi:hypothetical protein